MIKRYCDCCENEITEKTKINSSQPLIGKIRAHKRITGSVEWFGIKVIADVGSLEDYIHFCKYCIIDAVKRQDDRTRPECECNK